MTTTRLRICTLLLVCYTSISVYYLRSAFLLRLQFRVAMSDNDKPPSPRRRKTHGRSKKGCAECKRRHMKVSDRRQIITRRA